MYQGAKYLKVPPVSHQLNVNIATDKAQYLPGEPAQYSVEVTGADGKPAPRAEFSLGVVDEAIYAIRRDTTQDPLAFFFGREWNHGAHRRLAELTTSTARPASGACGWRSCATASRLAQLKPERLVQPKIRKAFPDTAFWAADLVTDARGQGAGQSGVSRFADHVARHRARRDARTPKWAARRSRPSCART